MIPYAILGVVAIFAGLVARSTVLKFWGGFFMQSLLTVVLFPLIGPACMFPGVIVILLLWRLQRRKRVVDPRACPFADSIREECQHYHEELCAKNPQADCAYQTRLQRKNLVSRSQKIVSLLIIALLGGYLFTQFGAEEKKKLLPVPVLIMSLSAAAR
jgi:hypothetical protein